MVAVGWTALMEKGLTWAVESSAGVSADGTVVESPTDLTAVTDSGNNVTVESIVYNKVAALDANPFNLELDRTISPTGHKLFCDKCEIYTDEFGIDRYKGKYVTDCCDQSIAEDIKANPDNYKVHGYEFLYEEFYGEDGEDWVYSSDYNWLIESNKNDPFYKKFIINDETRMNISSENMYQLGKDGNLYTTVECGDDYFVFTPVSSEEGNRIRELAIKDKETWD